MANGILETPIVVFIISMIAAGIIYSIGGRISPKTKESKAKVSPYACGEDLPAIKSSLGAKLFNYAALFLVLDVISIILLLTFGVSLSEIPIIGLLTIFYIFIVLLSVNMLLRGT